MCIGRLCVWVLDRLPSSRWVGSIGLRGTNSRCCSARKPGVYSGANERKAANVWRFLWPLRLFYDRQSMSKSSIYRFHNLSSVNKLANKFDFNQYITYGGRSAFKSSPCWPRHREPQKIRSETPRLWSRGLASDTSPGDNRIVCYIQFLISTTDNVLSEPTLNKTLRIVHLCLFNQ